MSGAVEFISKPFMAIPEDKRKALGLILVAIILLLFPLIHDDDADIDTAANALSYATLALGLNIVVGFAGLLDLGYAAFLRSVRITTAFSRAFR